MGIEFIAQVGGEKLSQYTQYGTPSNTEVLWATNVPSSDDKATYNSYFINQTFDFWSAGSATYDFNTYYIVVTINGLRGAFDIYRKSDNVKLGGFTSNNEYGGRLYVDAYLGVAIDRENHIGYLYTSSAQQMTNGTWQYYIGCPNSSCKTADIYNVLIANEIQPITSNGGGATHIAKVTGQLKDLSSNLSDILIVSGGGGGGLLVGETDYSGKEAGGISGSGDNSADQSTGNAFGQGESGTNVSGGGSGLYGGYKGTSSKSGGAGSGYIGNSLVSNKKMVGYNVPTSSAEGTKTESVNEASAIPVSGKPKIGNGFARITFLREPTILKLETYGTTIYGQFNILDGNTQNKTVVAKANSAPTSISDGIAFSLSSYTGNPFRMTGFSSNTHYYFVIFATDGGVSTKISEVADITTPSSISVLMDSDSSYIDSDMLVYSIVNQSTLYQNWYHYDSSNVYYYKNNYYNSGHSYLIFDNVINTGSYKYICVDAEIFEGSVPSAADQHWNYLAGAIVLASDGTPVCQKSYDSVTNAHKTVYMARWDEFIPANNKDWLTTGKLPRYMIKIPINDIPNTDIRLVIFSCDAKNRVYGVLLEG